jgi:hypothetical protein
MYMPREEARDDLRGVQLTRTDQIIEAPRITQSEPDGSADTSDGFPKEQVSADH